MNPEDRIRDAMAGRAHAARTSPDALDGVFTRVARRRRNVRIAAATGTTLSIVAVAAIGAAALRTPATEFVPAQPSPTVVTTPAQVPTPSASASASPSPAAHAQGPDRAVAVLTDGRLVELDTTSGEVLHTVTGLPRNEVLDVTYSRERHTVVVHLLDDECDLVEIDLDTGERTVVAKGGAPAYSPDGMRIASAGCRTGKQGEDSRVPVHVTDLATGTVTTYWPPAKPKNWPATEQYMDELVGIGDLTWLDGTTLAVRRGYEDYVDTILLDTRNDRSLADGTKREGESGTFAWEGRLYGLERCCYPEWKEPTKLVRVRADRAPQVLYTVPSTVTDVEVDGTGALVYNDGGELWRWEGWEDATTWNSGTRTAVLEGGATLIAT